MQFFVKFHFLFIKRFKREEILSTTYQKYDKDVLERTLKAQDLRKILENESKLLEIERLKFAKQFLM